MGLALARPGRLRVRGGHDQPRGRGDRTPGRGLNRRMSKLCPWSVVVTGAHARRRFMKFRYLFAGLALISAAACNSGDIVDPPGGIDIPNEAVRPFHATELAAASASNQFGIGLFKQVAASESDPNVLISPLSASMA